MRLELFLGCGDRVVFEHVGVHLIAVNLVAAQGEVAEVGTREEGICLAETFGKVIVVGDG